jgi:Bacterial PH domain
LRSRTLSRVTDRRVLIVTGIARRRVRACDLDRLIEIDLGAEREGRAGHIGLRMA